MLVGAFNHREGCVIVKSLRNLRKPSFEALAPTLSIYYCLQLATCFPSEGHSEQKWSKKQMSFKLLNILHSSSKDPMTHTQTWYIEMINCAYCLYCDHCWLREDSSVNKVPLIIHEKFLNSPSLNFYYSSEKSGFCMLVSTVDEILLTSDYYT